VPRGLTGEQRQALEDRFRYDTPFWAGGVYRTDDGQWHTPGPKEFQGLVKILPKQGGKLVPLVARPWQLELDEALENQRAADKPMRAIICKARKTGMSTWVAMKFLQRLTMIEYQHGIIVAQDVKTAGYILSMAKTAWAHLPSIEQFGLGFNVKPPIIGQSESLNGRKFMTFGEASKRSRELGRTGSSVFEVDTAGTPDSGRGLTPTMLHLSEYAWYEPNAVTRKVSGLMNAVPYVPETIVVIESTANGLNHFHKRWLSARDGQADPDSGESYAAIFIPWWRDPDCSQAFPTVEDRERFVETIGDENRLGEIAEAEQALIDLYGCTPEQLLWRRRMIREQHESNVELFKQENPASDEEAFIGSGRTVFSSILVSKAIRAAEEAPKPVTGSLRAGAKTERRTKGGTVIVPTEAIWVPPSDLAPGMPRLDVWEQPKKAGETDDITEDGAYVVAVDVAEGRSNTFTDGDFHVIQVWNHRTREQAAVHESRADLDELPELVLLTALYYNNAWLAPEINGPGIYVVETLKNTFRYPKLIKRSRLGTLKEDQEQKPGWKTDAQSKPWMEGSFAEALRDDTHGVRDLKTARQLQTYVITERGKHEAQAGEHDDRLVSAMIACAVMDKYQPPRPKSKRQAWRPTDPISGW